METYRHQVQYYETDKMDCVHHSNYIRWFEEARCHFLRSIGFGYERLEAAGISSPVLKAEAEYKQMARFGEDVRIRTRIGEYTGVRISFVYEIRDAASEALRCQGETKHCFLDRVTGRPVSLKKRLPVLHEMLLNQAADM